MNEEKHLASQIPSSRDSYSTQNGNENFTLESVSSKKKSEMLDEDSKRKDNAFRSFELVVNLVNHVLIGFITIYLSWMCLRLSLKKTAMHAWLCTIGYNFLMAEAMMTHYNGNTILFFYTRKIKTTVHWVLQSLGGSLGIAGGIVKMCEKETHFTTIHGKLGFASMVLCAVSMLSGISALYATSSVIKKILSPLQNKTIHNLLGLSAFVLGLVAQYYGYNTGFFKRQIAYDDYRIMIQVITLLTLVLSCWGPLTALWDKCRNLLRSF